MSSVVNSAEHHHLSNVLQPSDVHPFSLLVLYAHTNARFWTVFHLRFWRLLPQVI